MPDVAVRASAELALTAPELERLRPVAVQALRDLGDGPLQLSGPLRDALDAGHLLRTGDPARLDALEQLLRTGTPTNLRSMGGGPARQTFSNGELYRAEAVAPNGSSVSTVVKPADASATQEAFGSQFSRELGIDYLVPAVGLRADGSAWIEFRPGVTLQEAGVLTTQQLDEALTISYLVDGKLSPIESAQAAIIDRQLLQSTDHLTANIDRHGHNGLRELTGAGTVSFIDFGLIGRGARAEGGSVLSPALRRYQNEAANGVVKLDPVVTRYIGQRLTPAGIRRIHAGIYYAPGGPHTTPGSLGDRQFIATRDAGFLDGVFTRLKALVEHDGYTAAPFQGDPMTPAMTPQHAMETRGFRNVMRARHEFGFAG